MASFDSVKVTDFAIKRLRPSEFGMTEDRLRTVVGDIARYDLHFMRLTGVLDEGDEWGEGEYDEDDAFEYIYDAYLADNPGDGDDDLVIASLLNRYMEIKDDLD